MTPFVGVDSDNTPYEKIGTEVRSIADEIPFDIPETWEWVRCSSLGEIVRGSGIKRTETVPSGMPCVRYGELYTSYSLSFTEAKSFIPVELDAECKHFSYGDILMTLTGENKPDIAKAVAYLGNASIAAGGDLAYWTAHGMNPLYLVHVMSSPYVIARKVDLATGDIIVHISGDKIGSILIPIPPLAEQERIVQQIAELNSYVTEYGNKEAALSGLQTRFPEQLKKSILQMAVQGKLVPQNVADEPASLLLERIRTEKEALIKVGKIKRDKHESIIFRRDNSHYEKLDGIERCINDEIPFDIPDSWSWQRLPSIAYSISAGGDKPAVFSKEKTTDCLIPVYSNGEKNNGLFGYTNEPRITEKSITISGRGTIGFSCVRTEPYVPIVRLISVIPSSDMDLYYLQYVFTSLFEEGVGTSIQQLTVPMLITKLIPIPPIAEQKRIVQKVQELFSMLTML